MVHHTPLIGTIVAGLVIAFLLGSLAHRLKMPPIAGYLLAGIVIGPATPGFVADAGLAAELAEIGVILLMFGVGLHFSLKELLSVRKIAVPGAVVQITAATVMGAGLGLWLGWPLMGSLIFGLSLSVASTVVLLKALQSRDLVQTERGRIAVGWLIVEDLAMVLALVLLPAIVTAQAMMTHRCGSACELLCQPTVISASVMTPMVFCASFVPWARATSDEVKICPHRKPSRPSGLPS
jgi:CPA2 family monovalent cation:H+ antiporter-2